MEARGAILASARSEFWLLYCLFFVCIYSSSISLRRDRLRFPCYRVLRAFLVEEQKCVKQVLQVKERQKREEVKAESKKSKKSSK